MKQIDFENWETQDLEIAFGLEQVRDTKLLSDWLSSTTKFDESTKPMIDKLRDKILRFVDFWNEDELKMQGISQILYIADYTSDDYNVFSQRPLNAVLDEIELYGRVDFMLAKGRQKPIQPYFFIHEYKQERKGDSDPKGQLLAELLAAQVNNEYKFLMYGCYVVGRSWFFMVLEGKKYAVSNAFNASDEDIYRIIAILRKIKEYIAVWKLL